MNQTMKKLFSVVSITLCATIGLTILSDKIPKRAKLSKS